VQLQFKRLAALLLFAGVAVVLLATATAVSAVPLPVGLIDRNEVSVSGVSAGGYMAVQLHVAHSATFKKGAGVVAGGPFYCAEGVLLNATGRCMKHDAPIPVASLVSTTQQWATSGAVDPVANLQSSKVYLFSGTRDSVVAPAVVSDLRAYYAQLMPAANIVMKNDVAAEHAMVTDDHGSGCAVKGPPYINDCDFDLAGALLAHLIGPLSARNNGALSGRFIEFEQTAFVSGHGMAATGWVYVPQACTAGAGCRLHVVLHGCKQNNADVAQQYVRDTGYNRWADSNRIVVLYPQTGAGAVNSCWDWWGYDSVNYAKKSGPQVAAIKAMVDRLAGDTEPPPPPDNGGICFTASNLTHAFNGRAYFTWTGVFAVGSNQPLGGWFTRTTLKRTAPDHYAIGTCG
jgi:poly(3-hydroxybutyrate) depolymerase